MSVRTLIRVTPTIIKQYRSNKLLQNHIFCNCNNYTLYNLTKSTNVLHARTLFNDASKDEVEVGRERLYYGVLTPQIRAVKWFSLTTSAASLIAQPFLINTLYANSNTALVIAACSFIGFFTFVTPFLLHLITKKYVTHLDYDPKRETYIASTVNLVCMLKETEFKPSEVKVPDVPGMFTTFIAKGKPMFVEPRFFQDTSHYAKIMGYDKPVDFKLYATNMDDNKKLDDAKKG